MGLFAKVHNGVVEKVLVAEPEFFDTYTEDTPGTWIETFQDGSRRRNYASAGFYYDATDDVFYPPQPYPSWTLNRQTYTWEAPVPLPNDGPLYRWDERILNWVR
jgi:hypothetical protein